MEQKKLIVVAEDSKTQAEQTRFLLEEIGYSVILCENGEIAFKEIQKSHPDLVISDIVMPVMDGYELCAAIKSDDELKDIPVMLLTTLNSPEDVKQGLLARADDFMPKPINLELFEHHVRHLIEHLQFDNYNEKYEALPNEKVLNFLMSTYETAILKNLELEKTKDELSNLNMLLERKVKERTKELNLRVKELNCLHEVNDLYESIDYSSPELLKQTCYILKNSFLGPEKVEIQIEMNFSKYQTPQFNPNANYTLSSPIKSMRKIIGTIEVSYNMECRKNPFSMEEKRMVDSVARRMFELFELGKKEKQIIEQNSQLKENLSEIQKINVELEESRRKAVESDRLKSAFLANMSHEIRTPLNSIVGFSDIYDDPDFDGETREHYAKIIKESSKHLLNVVNDVLDISKIDTGQMRLSFEEFKLNDLLEEIYSMYLSNAEGKGINLILSNAEDDSLTVRTDKNKFFQIFSNLIVNAIKFTNVGTVEFGTLEYQGKKVFYVKDSGIGIPEDFKEKVFERFIQVDSSTIRQYGGTGLGLAITKKLVELMGGEVWFESEVNKGTIFYFNISLSQESKN